MARAPNPHPKKQNAGADALRLNIEEYISRVLSPQAMSNRLVELAETRRDELITSGRAIDRYRTSYDGRQWNGGPHISGTIVHNRISYNFDYVGDATAFTIAYLKTWSARMSGESHSNDPTPYKNSFVVAVNGIIQSMNTIDTSKITTKDTVLIYNTQPYGRKADSQQVGGRKPMDYPLMERFIFENVQNALRRRYGKLIVATRLYTVGSVPKHYVRTTLSPGRRKLRLIEYPTIKITDGR